VLPSPDKRFLPDQPKSSAAGEKIRPRSLLFSKGLFYYFIGFIQWFPLQNGRKNKVNYERFLAFVWRAKLKKVRPLFDHFLANLAKIRPQFFTAAQNFLQPLLCLKAEIFASWQQ
jgi:hypothetical protein